MRKRGYIILLMLIGTVMMAGCGSLKTQKSESSEIQNENKGTKTGTFASFAAEDLFGEYQDETLFQGKKLTMFNVWATFCGPCLQEMPDLGELNKEYEEKDVQIVGVVLDVLDHKNNVVPEQVEYAIELVNETGADYLHLIPSEDLLQAGLAQVYAVPTTYFIDSNGEVIGEPYLGARSKEEWMAVLDSLLSDLEE